jgi:hypothetical protein
LNVLALNSGSSSLKFGLYRVGSSRIERLLSGEAESIGDKSGKCHAEDARGNALLSETGSIPSQREAIIRIGRLLVDAKMPVPAAIGHRIVHGGPKLRQHCLIDDSVLTQLEAATAFAPLHIPSALVGHPLSHKSIFRGFRRRRVSTPPFTPNCRKSRVSFQSPGNCNSRVSNVMGFTAFRANRLCSNSRTICRTVS